MALADEQGKQLEGKPVIRFWRLHIDGNTGIWHLYNEEDRNFLSDVAKRITNGQYDGAKIEWFEIEGRLPR